MTDPRSLRCARQYAKEASAVVGPQYERIMFEKMTRQVVARQYENHKTEAILNLGPGSTGTNSMFTAMRMLNISARHYTQISFNCQYLQSKLYYEYFGDKLEPMAGELVCLPLMFRF